MSDLQTLTGMVLEAAPVGDYDKRLVLLTRERGRITAFARGARRPNSQLLAASNPFAFGSFELFPGRDAWRLSRAEIRQYFRELVMDVEGAYYGFYFLEFASFYSREEADASELLTLLYLALRALTHPAIPKKLARRIFELRTMVINGEYPQVFHCVRCGKEQELTAYAVREDGLVCRDCAGGSGQIRLDPSTVYTLQYIVTSTVRKLFTFTVSDTVLGQLEKVVDAFRERWADHAFKSLEILRESNFLK